MHLQQLCHVEQDDKKHLSPREMTDFYGLAGQFWSIRRTVWNKRGRYVRDPRGLCTKARPDASVSPASDLDAEALHKNRIGRPYDRRLLGCWFWPLRQPDNEQPLGNGPLSILVDLLRKIVLLANLFHQLELGLEPIDVLLFGGQNLFEQLAGPVVLDLDG